MAKIKFMDSLTGLEDKNMKWVWPLGPKVGMVISDDKRSYIITDVIFKKNDSIVVYMSIKKDNIIASMPLQKLLEIRREELLRKK